MIRLLVMLTAAAFASNLASVADAWRAAWTPRPRPVRSQWCEAEIRLPREFAAQPGQFSFEGREYQREILDAIDDPSVREIVFVAPPQVGKTELERAVILSQGEVDAAPMMFAGPDQLYAREQREICYKMADSMPALRDRVARPELRNDRWIDLERCYVFLAWSGSSQRLSGRSCKIVLCSEVDRWQLSIKLAKQRTKAFWRSCVIYEGSPVGESPNVYPLYRQSDRRTFQVQCPHCGHYQELRFFVHKQGPFAGQGGVAGYTDDEGNCLAPEAARRGAYYLCERNGCRIDSRDKTAMIDRGRWCPEGCHVDKRGRVRGKPANPGRLRGYRLNALYSPTCSFGDIAEEYARSKDSEEGMLSFFNDWLGLPYKPRGRTPEWRTLGRRLAGHHPRGTVPAGAYFLTAGADVHQDNVHWVCRAWGDACTSWLVDWGILRRLDRGQEEPEEELSSDLAQLTHAVVNRRWPVRGRNPLGYEFLGVRLLGIDCNYRPTDVYQFVLAHPGGRVLAVWGDPKIVPGTLYRRGVSDKNVRTNEPYPEGTERWGIETNAYKADLMGRWYADRERPGVWWLTADIMDTGEAYLKQITNERRETAVTIAGRKTIRWECISHELGVHYWDCEVYARALADMVTGQEWDVSRWTWVGKSVGHGAKSVERADLAAREMEDFSAR